MAARQPDDPGVDQRPVASPFAGWQLVVTCVAILLTATAMFGGAMMWVGRTADRLDAIDSKLSRTTMDIDRLTGIAQDTAIGMARIQGALGVPTAKHAALP